MKKHPYLLLICFIFSVHSFSQSIWKKNNAQSQTLKQNKTKRNNNLYTLDINSLTNILSNTSSTNKRAKASKVILEFPNVEGEFETYYILEHTNFSEGLANKFPKIKSYKGVSTKNEAITINFSVSALGVKTMRMETGKKNVFIEPINKNDQLYEVFYSKTDSSGINCLTKAEAKTASKIMKHSKIHNTNDQVLRTYRLAMSATAEYTQYFGGTKENALAAINATMTRVNAIFERDFSVNMLLISNNDEIIYLDPETDPYSDSDVGISLGLWNGELQENLTSTIGEENYDIGHLFGNTGGGGNAGCIGCVCVDGMKGSAYTSPKDDIPEGHSFDVDFVSHEMGHQFGANHTFSQYEDTGAGANLEPGSGSTIMGYAGVTGSYDVQKNSDDYFHFFSVKQISDYVKTTSCALETPLNNMPPTANAGADYTIPSGTAFKLTAEGSDPNGDPITYTWEEADETGTYVFSKPDPNYNYGILFRSRPPSTNPTRYFPALDRVIDGYINDTWETVSKVSRTLNFNVLVRDNAQYGQTASDMTEITVDATHGAFKLTTFSKNYETLASGSNVDITWDVAGTDQSPFNSPKVNILLSVDGGVSFTTLASETDNDGAETITLPANTPSAKAVFIVESVGNIFYAASKKFYIDYVTECTDFVATGLPISFEDAIDSGDNKGEYRYASFDVSGITDFQEITVNVDISHPFIGDIQIKLESPSGTLAGLYTVGYDIGCRDQKDMKVTFSDFGKEVDCETLGSEVILPYNSLIDSYRNENITGVWKIGVRDAFYGDKSGVFNSATLSFCHPVSINK